MKVLYVDQTGQLGGAELSMLDVVKHLPFEKEVILFEDGPFREALETAGALVSVLKATGVSGVRKEDGWRSVVVSLPGLMQVRNEVAARVRSADVVYANTQKAFVVAALANGNTPLVWHLRDMLTATDFSPVLRRLVVLLANRRASAVIANSHATRDAFIESGGSSHLVTVVHNGIGAESFESVSEEMTKQTRADLRVDGAFLVGVFGRLSPWKGQDVLLRALRNLPPDVHAVLVGDALFGEKKYAEQIEELGNSAGLRGRVHLLGFRKDVPALMRAMDIIAHTSIAPEPFGRVIVEGMLAERPVVATAAGGALEIIQDGVSGLLVPPGDADALACAVAKLRDDAALRSKLVRGGFLRAEQFFSLESMLTGVSTILQRACLRRAAVSRQAA